MCAHSLRWLTLSLAVACTSLAPSGVNAAAPLAPYTAKQLRAAVPVFASFQRGQVDRDAFKKQLHALGISYQHEDILAMRSLDKNAFLCKEEFLEKNYDRIITDLVGIARKNRFVMRNWSQFMEVVSADPSFEGRWGKLNLKTTSWIAIRDRRGNKRLYSELKKIGLQVSDGKGPSAAGRKRISAFQRARAAALKDGAPVENVADAPPSTPSLDTSRRASAKALAARLMGEEPNEQKLMRIYAELGKSDPNLATRRKAMLVTRTFEGVFPELRKWNFDPHRPYALRYIARWTLSAHEAGPGADYDQIAAIFRKSPEYAEDGRLFPPAKSTVIQARERPELISSWAVRRTYQRQRQLIELLRTAPTGTSLYKLKDALGAIGLSSALTYQTLKRIKLSNAGRLGFDRKTLAAVVGGKVGLGQPKDESFDPNREPPEIDLDFLKDIVATPITPQLHELALARLDGRLPFRSKQVLFVNHRYSDIVPFVDLFHSAGLAYASTAFVSTPYPFKDAVTYQLRDRGVETFVPEQNMASMQDTVAKGLDHLLARYDSDVKLGKSPQTILIIDDGGMAAKVIAKRYPDRIGIFRIVEITPAGDRLAGEFETQYGRLPFVYNSIARSEAKQQVTSKFFGTRVVDRIASLLPQTGIEPNNKKVAIIGGGPMGRFAAERAKALKMDVTIVEKDKELARSLREAGWTVKPIEEALPGRGLILGMTGYQTVLTEHLDLIDDGAILAQGSSKRNEFDMGRFEKLATSKVELPRTDGLAQKSYTYTFGRGAKKKDLHFLGDGWTINHDGSLAGTPIEDIALEHVLVFESAVEALSTPIKATGEYHVVGKEAQDYYVKQWKALRARD